MTKVIPINIFLYIPYSPKKKREENGKIVQTTKQSYVNCLWAELTTRTP